MKTLACLVLIVVGLISSFASAVDFRFGYSDHKGSYVIFSDEGIFFGNERRLSEIPISSFSPSHLQKLAIDTPMRFVFDDGRAPNGKGQIEKGFDNLVVYKNEVEGVLFELMRPGDMEKLRDRYRQFFLEVIFLDQNVPESVFRVGDIFVYLQPKTYFGALSMRYNKAPYIVKVSANGKPFKTVKKVGWSFFDMDDRLTFVIDGELFVLEVQKVKNWTTGRQKIVEAKSIYAHGDPRRKKDSTYNSLEVTELSIDAPEVKARRLRHLNHTPSTPYDIFVNSCDAL